jgi:hypothetical protein
MATITPLPNGIGYHIEDVNWMTVHYLLLLQNQMYGEIYAEMPRLDCVSPNNIRCTLCRGAESYVIPLHPLKSWYQQIPGGTFAGRTVRWGTSDLGGFRKLRVQINRSGNPAADEIWQIKLRVMIPVNGITDVDATEQLGRSDVAQIDIHQ